METNVIPVDLPQEEVFKRILDHIRGEKYLLLLRKRGYDITKVVPPSHIEVMLGSSWGARGKMDIEVTPSDEGSLIEVNFEVVSGKIELVGCGLLLFFVGLLKPFLLLIVGAVASPVFLSWLDVYTAKDGLVTELKQLFQNRYFLLN